MSLFYFNPFITSNRNQVEFVKIVEKLPMLNLEYGSHYLSRFVFYSKMKKINSKKSKHRLKGMHSLPEYLREHTFKKIIKFLSIF
jgi:hypothetical protein